MLLFSVVLTLDRMLAVIFRRQPNRFGHVNDAQAGIRVYLVCDDLKNRTMVR